MIKIFIESDKISHKAGVTKHATNSLACKSQKKQVNNIYNDYSLLFTIYIHDDWLVSHLIKVSCLTGLIVSSF